MVKSWGSRQKVRLFLPTNVQLIITFSPETGAIQVTGPVQDTLYCLGLLEAAKDAIKNISKGQTLIVPPMKGTNHG